ncbi:alpha/beta hydrolase [Couchioplanes caeruleus]|uniref:alpha/beta fold hydrolase n=1 Tax=Couchioplanes caeruleus TaxID=56438 RepID=UPI0020BEB2C0|nr:alpha/beta hydrolase [Couchioplanes caeruleus]UQU66168.1 alpha/beta hydrolase [Couchioplanes caeruleus]
MPTIRSADGTPIDVTTSGSGPGLVVVPGGLRHATDYARFGRAMADVRTVHVLERRGRGASGPPGAAYGIEREAEDAEAVLDATGSGELFGHSFGGLIGLHVALRRRLDRLVLFDPAVSLHGSFDTHFLPAFERRLAAGRDAAAMAGFLTGLGFAPAGVLPVPAWTLFAWIMLHTPGGRETRALLHTLPREWRVAAGLDSDGTRYAAVTSPTLIIAGGHSPEWLRRVQPELARLIPRSAYTCSPGLDHNAPDQSAPATVAELVRTFLTTGDAGAR